MNWKGIVLAMGISIVAWLPYLVLQGYWICLRITVPDAAHGEISGPVLYFLPRLFAAAVLVSLLIVTVATIVLLKSSWARRKSLT